MALMHFSWRTDRHPMVTPELSWKVRPWDSIWDNQPTSEPLAKGAEAPGVAVQVDEKARVGVSLGVLEGVAVGGAGVFVRVGVEVATEVKVAVEGTGLLVEVAVAVRVEVVVTVGVKVAVGGIMVAGRVDLDGCPPRPPTDPDLRN